MSVKALSSATSRRRAWCAALAATAASLSVAAPSAGAQGIVVSGNGVLAGNVIQIPITAPVPIRVCSNNVATISVNLFGVKACS